MYSSALVLLLVAVPASAVQVTKPKAPIDADQLARRMARVNEVLAAAQPKEGVKAAKCLDASAWWKEQEVLPYGQGIYSERDQDVKLVSLFDKAHLGTTNKFFVEFGFTGIDNSMSELLRQVHNWTGFRLDGGKREERIMRAWNLHQHFITPENIVSLFEQHGSPKEPDYVSIDIDSTDLWVFNNLTKVFRPRAMTVEYKSRTPFGIEYESNQQSSMTSINLAAQKAGYTMVGVEANLDLFLVRKDLVCHGSEVDVELFRKFTGKSPHENTPNEHLRIAWSLDQEKSRLKSLQNKLKK